MTTGNNDNFVFTCNICGTSNPALYSQRHREMLPCNNCHSCARFRGIVKAFQIFVMRDTSRKPISDQNSVLDVRGIGMSDSDVYARELAKICNYTNTFYHTEPWLDITSSASAENYRELDFVISSDGSVAKIGGSQR